jgi:hypothetical protein
MNEQQAAARVAQAEAEHQLSRPFARGLRHGLTAMQLDAVRALVRGAALGAIEAWEKGRAARESAAFYEGKTGPLA